LHLEVPWECIWRRFSSVWLLESMGQIEPVPGLLDLRVSGLLELTCLPNLLSPFVNLQALHLDFMNMEVGNRAAALLLPHACSNLRWLHFSALRHSEICACVVLCNEFTYIYASPRYIFLTNMVMLSIAE
jgi:hypothetical protein